LVAQAIQAAGEAGHRTGLAEALELKAIVDTEPGRARAALREADAIWTDAGAVLNAARIRLALGHLAGAGADDRFAALVAAELLAAENVPIDPPRVDGTEVALKTLGRFEVCVGGQPVPATAWQSRRARDLVRILIARRGRPVPRAELSELLWPDDDATKTGHRLSVLLSIVRGVLDPTKRYGPDQYLVADAACVALDVTHLRVDVLEFLAAVAHGRRLRERGALSEARTVLTAAVREYTADPFEDEPYADWSDALREQARSAYVCALRILAESHRAANSPAAAVDCLLRLLERDPYDEPAHRALVRTLATAGQHGEARRALARYRAAMRAIGVREPDDSVLPTSSNTSRPRIPLSNMDR
jgi:DNA-binding SARP family transcriptional activator